MGNIKDLFKAIEKTSKEISINSENLTRKMSSANIYVANQNLEKWAFSKLIATTNFDITYGAQAKPFFYSHGFIDVLEIENAEFKNQVIEKFLIWCKTISYIDLVGKFHTDQNKLKRFELLVHTDLVPKQIFKSEKLLDKNYDEFVEGFKREITKENTYRNQKLIDAAKKHFEPTCQICGFNFEQTYGLHGKGFIEMHHLIPISEGERNSTLKDLVPVCSNCHRMLHKGKVTLAVEDIKDMIAKNKAST